MKWARLVFWLAILAFASWMNPYTLWMLPFFLAIAGLVFYFRKKGR